MCVPVLGKREEEGSEHDVAEHEQQTDVDRYAHLHTTATP